MHDQEVGIINVELHGLEQVLHCLLLGAMAVDEVFRSAAKDDLACDGDLAIFFEAYGGLLLVSVVEDDCNRCFSDSSLTTFVDEIL